MHDSKSPHIDIYSTGPSLAMTSRRTRWGGGKEKIQLLIGNGYLADGTG